MGQFFGKPNEFPKNFTKLNPTTKHCRGPGLIENLTSGTREVYPKCIEGMHLKLRNKISDTFKLGYNVVFSTVTPSGGQFVLTHMNELGNSVLAMSPNGTMAFISKYQLSARNIVEGNCQIQLKHISVGLISLSHVGLKHTSSINISICHLPFGSASLRNNFLVSNFDAESLRRMKKFYGDWGAEHVHEINKIWAIGFELLSDKNVRMVVYKRMSQGKIGILLDKSRVELFWQRRLTPRFELGGTADFYWNKRAPTATLAGSWKTPKFIAKVSVTSDGLISSTLRKIILRTEDKLFSITLSSVFNHQNNKFLLGAGIEGQL